MKIYRISQANEYAVYVGTMENPYDDDLYLYNLKVDIEGHPADSTVSRQTLEEANIPVPQEVVQASQEGDEDIERSNEELRAIIDDLKQQYPWVELWAYETDTKIEISHIKIPPEMRGQGVGRKAIEKIKEHARKRGKPVVAAPEAEKGYKRKLDDWYKGMGFVDNKGRNKDYEISEPFSRTMYWRP